MSKKPKLDSEVSFYKKTRATETQLKPKFATFKFYEEKEVFYVSDSEYYMPEQIETWREC